MRASLPKSGVLRAKCTMFDTHGRGYLRLTSAEHAQYAIPRGNTWWWCVLPLRRYRRGARGTVPRIGWRVNRYMIHKVSLGFERGGVVGIVGMR